jgi:scyllo-inositol 2-dehydrogenase (NADP+)
MVHVGLIGFGLAGRYFHAPLIEAAGMKIAAVVTRRAQEAGEVVPCAAVLDSADALLNRGDIDLVVIATPNDVHFALARAALLAGKHVVIDKPFTVTAADAQLLAALAKRTGRQLAAFHNRRWDCDFLTIQRLISEHRLGEINLFCARWDRYRPLVADRWRERQVPGAGTLYDLGVHLIDQMLHLFGKPEWIQAEVWRQRTGSVADDAFELLFGKGALRMLLGASTLAADPGWRYRINGSRASFIKAAFDPQESQLRSGVKADAAQFGIEPPEQWGRLTDGDTNRTMVIESERGRWTSFYSSMGESIRHGTPVPVAAQDGAATVEIIEAALEGSRTGRRVMLAPAV